MAESTKTEQDRDTTQDLDKPQDQEALSTPAEHAEEIETPDKPVEDWSDEERHKVAHSHDKPTKEDPGYDEEDDTTEKGFIKLDEESELEGQGESLMDRDTGASEDDRIPATTAGLGVPRPTDLAPENTEATIDINSADVDELCKLRGVAKVDAEEIISHRDERGPFESVNDLVDVEGFARSRVATIARQGAYAGGGSDGDGNSRSESNSDRDNEDKDN